MEPSPLTAAEEESRSAAELAEREAEFETEAKVDDEAGAGLPDQIDFPETPNPFAPYTPEQLLQCCLDCEEGSCSCDSFSDCNLFITRFPGLRDELVARRKTSRRRLFSPYKKTKYDLPTTTPQPPSGGAAGLALAGLAASLRSGPREPGLRSVPVEQEAHESDSDSQFGYLVASTLRESNLSVAQKLGLQGEILSLLASRIGKVPKKQ